MLTALKNSKLNKRCNVICNHFLTETGYEIGISATASLTLNIIRYHEPWSQVRSPHISSQKAALISWLTPGPGGHCLGDWCSCKSECESLTVEIERRWEPVCARTHTIKKQVPRDVLSLAVFSVVNRKGKKKNNSAQTSWTVTLLKRCGGRGALQAEQALQCCLSDIYIFFFHRKWKLFTELCIQLVNVPVLWQPLRMIISNCPEVSPGAASLALGSESQKSEVQKAGRTTGRGWQTGSALAGRRKSKTHDMQNLPVHKRMLL